jgi:vancomycin resistance protein VanJ
MATSSPRPVFLWWLAAAGVRVLVSLHTGLVISYYVAHWLGGNSLWFVDAIAYVLPWLFVPTLLLLPAALLLRRSRPVTILAAAPVALFLLTYGHLYLSRWPVSANGPAFTALTYNVLYKNENVAGVAAAIEAHDPDFFGLRELVAPMAEALGPRFAARYPYHRLEPGCGFWSRYPILEYEGFQLVEGEGDWVQQFVLDIESYEVNVLSVHPRSLLVYDLPLSELPSRLPAAFADPGRDADLRALLARLEGIEGPLVVMGDFNVTDQQSLYAPLARRLRDAHRESGWGMGFTFISGRGAGPPVWRIDYVFHSSDLVALSTRVGDRGGSDHRPVIARLAFRAGK